MDLIKILNQPIATKPVQKKKWGLALSGGGALGIAHLGVLEILEKNNIIPDFISGTSAGSLIASLYAFGMPLEKIKKEAKTLSWYKLSKLSFSKQGLASNSAIGALVEKFIGKVKIENARIPLGIVATNIAKGEKVILTKGSVSQAITASSCIPGLYTPIKIQGKQLVDGGIMENVPVSALKALGAEITIAVDLGGKRKYKKADTAAEIILNSLDILMHKSQTKAAADFYIQPDMGNIRLVEFSKYKKLISAGRLATEKSLPEIKTILGL